MTYQVPPPKPEPAERYQLMTDPTEIAAMLACEDIRAPIGEIRDGKPYGTVHSLRQFRQQEVSFNV